MRAGTILMALLLGTSWCGRAADLVLSNLGQDLGDATLFDASGSPLESGGLIQVVVFPGLDSNAVGQLVQNGIDGVLAASTLLGSTAVGVGTTGDSGGFEVVVQTPASAEMDGLHLLIFNAPSAAESDQFALLRLPGTVPEDEIGGFDGFYARHLGEAALVFGGQQEGGFSTLPATVAPTFDTWISLELPEGSPAEDLLETADPDFDGRSNLLEYGTGTSAAVADFSPVLQLEQRPAGIHLRYLRRIDDPVLSTFAELSFSLSGWAPLGSAEETSTEDAPAGFEWVEQVLPGASGRAFARVRVQRFEE